MYLKNPIQTYNTMILHETLRVSVCENLENENFKPDYIKEVMRNLFTENYDHYVEACKKNLHLDGTKIIVN